MMGAVTGFVWLNNDPKSRQSGLAFDREHLRRRLRAMTFSAGYSTQFRFGSISEISLGNVGIKPGKKSHQVDGAELAQPELQFRQSAAW